jgi:hypothetical protein
MWHGNDYCELVTLCNFDQNGKVELNAEVAKKGESCLGKWLTDEITK